MNPSSSIDSSRKSQPKRSNSNPFYRKALPSAVEVEVATSSSPRRRPVTNVANCDDPSPNKPTFYKDIKTDDDDLKRHLTLIDLVAIGVGGTVGSGLFVLTGLVAQKYAGPAAALSWCGSGLAACLSGFCYAELAGRIPLAGSAYAYAYVAMGEIFAVTAAACLSLEYVCASAAVARSWGDKASEYWVNTSPETAKWILPSTDGTDSATHTTFNPMALVVSSSCVGLLLCGVNESKRVTHFFTALKITLVLFMIVMALHYTQPSNWQPWAPYGVAGIARGATSTFFGYLGYDQVCCLAGEAIDSKRNMPRAILGVLSACAALYVVATLALTGMIRYDQISAVAGFPDAFRDRGAVVVAQVVALGEIITMPIVILVTVMVQPRLFYAMSVDGLLPSIFKVQTADGNLVWGLVFTGGLFIVVSTWIPFEHLNDMIACAVLSALSLTDTSLVMLWHEPTHDPKSPLTCRLMMLFHAAALLGSLSFTHYGGTIWGRGVAALSLFVMVGACFSVHKFCPRTACFGGSRKNHYREEELRRGGVGYFETPLVPFLPCLAIAVNWALVAQLDLSGIALMIGLLLVTVLYYLLYAQHHSLQHFHSEESDCELTPDANKMEKRREEATETTRLMGTKESSL